MTSIKYEWACTSAILGGLNFGKRKITGSHSHSLWGPTTIHACLICKIGVEATSTFKTNCKTLHINNTMCNKHSQAILFPDLHNEHGMAK